MDSPSIRRADGAPVLRPYRPGDEAAINRAFNEVFNQNRSLEEWQWKFQPAAAGSHILLILGPDTGEVLAQFAVLRAPFRIGDKVYSAALSVDDFCRRRPDLVLGRSYTRLVQTFHETYGRPGVLDFLYGFPGLRHLRLLLHQEGYEPPVEVPFYQSSAASAGFFSFSRWKVVPMTSAPALDDLYSRCADRYASGIVRNGAWLQRRYLTHPAQCYLSVAATRGRCVHAWAVFRVMNDSLVWGDLLWDGRHPGALQAINRWAKRTAAAAGVTSLTLWLHGDAAAAAVLCGLGWQPKPNPLALAATTLRYAGDLPARLLPATYFTMGDSDLF